MLLNVKEMRMKQSWNIAVYLLAGMALGTVGTLAMRSLRNPSLESEWVCATVARQEREQRFVALVEAFRTMLRSQGGEIPEDPYRAMIDGGQAGSYMEFLIDHRAVIIEPQVLPPKLNPDMGRNRRELLMSLAEPDGTFLVAFWDGTWERLPAGGGRMARLQLDQRKALNEGGYPYWVTPEERGGWQRTFTGELVWDDGTGMYVPRRNDRKR